MVNPEEYYEYGLVFHGHKCPAMPMGLRVGAAALNALGVERAKDGQLVTLIEIGDDHCATCFADGIQMITGCTFGKGNIQKTHYGKWGVTVIDVATSRAIRVVPKAEAMLANKQSVFFKEYREKGIPASHVPESVIDPMVQRVMGAPDDALFSVGEIYQYDLVRNLHSFASIVCDACGEMVVEEYARIKGTKHICIPCQENHKIS